LIERNENLREAFIDEFLGKFKLPVGIFDVWKVICQVLVEDFSPDFIVDVELGAVEDFDRV
jgi:hypothetical protein